MNKKYLEIFEKYKIEFQNSLIAQIYNDIEPINNSLNLDFENKISKKVKKLSINEFEKIWNNYNAIWSFKDEIEDILKNGY